MAIATRDEVLSQLGPFMGDTGGIDSWLSSPLKETVLNRLENLTSDPLSCSQMNQLLALSHQAEFLEGAFRYYWLDEPVHTYDVSRLPGYHSSYRGLDRILSLDQLSWGLYRLYYDSFLYYGSIRNGFREIRSRDFEALDGSFRARRFPSDQMIHRGAALPLNPVSQDDRYLIAEQACKSFEPSDDHDLLFVLRGAWEEHARAGGGKVKARQLLSSAFVLESFKDKQKQFEFAADELLDQEVESEGELIQRYESVRRTFTVARKSALQNTDLYLSMANDLDVYVATSMRSREHFRKMANFCDTVFGHPVLRPFLLRYFNPTLSAARGHEDKGLIECLMVKCAKVLIYMAGDRDSYGKDAEAAMAMSLGKPVIFFCDEVEKKEFFKEVHPLSRLIDFQTGVAVGAMATSSTDEVAVLLNRTFDNKMEYELDQPRPGYLRLKERITGSTVRLQTDDRLLRETFWNCYHRPIVR